MSTVTLNISDFRIFYPAFEDASKYPDSLITLMFNQACAILGNSDDSIYPYDPTHGKLQRMFILYAATCHLLTLRGMAPGQTGRITSASQGSVSTSFDTSITGNSYSSKWWSQTPCGQMVWKLTAPYRQAGMLYTNFPDYHPYG